MKICISCKETKLFSDFGKQKGMKSGLRSSCYECTKKRKIELTSTKEKHLACLLSKCKSRSKKLNIPFDLDLNYLLSISSEYCPVFNSKLVWGRGNGFSAEFSPSLDRLIPDKGYIKGNMAIISFKANRMKNNGSTEEIRKLLNWLEKNG